MTHSDRHEDHDEGSPGEGAPSRGGSSIGLGSIVLDRVRRILGVRSDEFAPVLWSGLYAFFTLASFYVLRPVRDEISSEDLDNVPMLWTVGFLVMLVVVPLYSKLTTLFSRAVFIPLVNTVFFLCVLGFWVSVSTVPEELRLDVERVFYVWFGVFNLFIVTVFWSFMADLWRNEQGRRLFGLIAVGGSIGALSGAGLTGTVITVGQWMGFGGADGDLRFLAFPMSALLLVGATVCATVLHKWRAHHASAAEERAVQQNASAEIDAKRGAGSTATPRVADKPLRGGLLSGVIAIGRSWYLAGICLYVFLLTVAAAVFYLTQSELLRDAMPNRDERTALLAVVEVFVQSGVILIQCFLTGRVVGRFGVGATLMIQPLLCVGAFLLVGIHPILAVCVAVQALRRLTNYALAKPAREILFTVVPRAEKYQAKAFIDTAVYRGGDSVVAWVFAALRDAASLGAIALGAVPLAIAWALIGHRLGRIQDRRAASLRGACDSCGYDLRGSNGRCPGCGVLIDAV